MIKNFLKSNWGYVAIIAFVFGVYTGKRDFENIKSGAEAAVATMAVGVDNLGAMMDGGGRSGKSRRKSRRRD